MDSLEKKKIDRLYKLLEDGELDNETSASLKWAIFELENKQKNSEILEELKISYECSELIEELRQDILEFGKDTIINVWCKDINGVTLYVNYDFITEELPVGKSELIENEYIKEIPMGDLLKLLEKQNKNNCI